MIRRVEPGRTGISGTYLATNSSTSGIITVETSFSFKIRQDSLWCLIIDTCILYMKVDTYHHFVQSSQVLSDTHRQSINILKLWKRGFLWGLPQRQAPRAQWGSPISVHGSCDFHDVNGGYQMGFAHKPGAVPFGHKHGSCVLSFEAYPN